MEDELLERLRHDYAMDMIYEEERKAEELKRWREQHPEDDDDYYEDENRTCRLGWGYK